MNCQLLDEDGVCVNGMDDPAWCTRCNGRDQREEAVQRHVMVQYTFEAKYDGRCSNCHASIEVGDLICKLTDDSFVCEECGNQ